MLDVLGNSTGERLELADYWPDFERQFWRTKSPGFWKLERGQVFREPGEPSWVAFAEGSWHEALRIIESKRPEFRRYYARIANAGFVNRRVRVVEFPITRYLQWELHVLRLRHEHGGLTSVVTVDQVSHLEHDGPLPEIYTLGTEVMYEAVYGPDGELAAANRFTDRAQIAACQRLIESLYRMGEPLDAFFERAVAPLEPPIGRRKA